MERLVDLETGVEQDVELVDIGASIAEPEQLVDFNEESKFAADYEARTILINTEGDVGTTLLVPENLTSPVVQDPFYLAAPHDTSNFSPTERLVHSTTSDEPISVTVEAPTPIPFVELPLVDITTPVIEPEVPEAPEPTVVVPIVIASVSPPASPLCEDKLIELADVPMPHSGQVSPVGTLEAWSWDDAWNFGVEQETTNEVQLAKNQTTKADGGFVQSDTAAEYITEVEPIDEESWFVEEVTIVWPDEEPARAVVEGKEKMIQEVDLSPSAFYENPESSTRPVHAFESELLMQQKPGVHEALEADDHDDLEDEIYENNDSNMNKTILDSLAIPLITISVEEFPDLDLLPLPPKPTSPTHKPDVPSSPEARSYPSQTPTPPASPPASPSRSLPASALSSPNIASPVTLPSSPSFTPTSTRPAWSLRASDAPALGLPAPPSLKQRSSPDLRSRHRLLSAVAEEQISIHGEADVHLKGDLDPTKDNSVTKDETPKETNVEVQDETTKADEQISETVITELSTALPGSFPTTQPLEAPPTSLTPTASSTALAPATTPRRRTTRSPLDIALAMQLRPGLGVGADPAWMVRFLMSMFGWFAILLSGQAEFDSYRNGSYPVGH